MELAERHTGQKPAWTGSWDTSPPDWQAESVLTADEAVALALRNNRELRAELELIGQAQADLVQAGLLKNPVVSLGALLPSGGGRAMLEGGIVPFQGLRDLWLIPIREEAARSRLQEAILRAVDLSVDLTAQVKRLYARIQYTQRAIALTQENLALVDQMVRIIQSRYAAGQTGQIEVNTERIRYLRLQSDLLTMQTEHRRLKRELMMLMGLAESPDVWRAEALDEMKHALTSAPSSETLVALALEQRLDLRAGLWSLDAAQSELATARREAWPELMVGLGFERAEAPRSQNPSLAAQAGNAAIGALSGGAPEPPTLAPLGPKERDMKWMVGPMMEIELPVFDQNQAQIAKAAHELRRRAALYESLRQRVLQKVQDAKLLHDQAAEQVRFFREAIIPEVERNMGLVQQSYRAGADVFTVYLQAQEDLITTRLNALNFVRDLALAQVDLEREVGGRIPKNTSPPQQPATENSEGVKPSASKEQ